jgi:hypothetical protein
MASGAINYYTLKQKKLSGKNGKWNWSLFCRDSSKLIGGK